MREVAHYEADRYAAVGRWPLREMLVSYVARVRERAIEDYTRAQLVYVIQQVNSRKKLTPPKLPAALSKMVPDS